MCYWFLLLSYVLVFVVAKPSEKGECGSKCTGTEYECFEGHCYCAAGYIQNYFQTSCVKCPDLGDKCFGTCCNTHSNSSLQCWHGECQPCYDSSLNWICRDTVDQILLVSTTQVVMGTALVLGIVATLVLLMKLCAKTSLRPLGSNLDSRLSIGSLQTYVDERLRDAPPRYSGATPANTTAPVLAYQNECFIPDSSIPPPPYSEVIKNENNQNIAVHI